MLRRALLLALVPTLALGCGDDATPADGGPLVDASSTAGDAATSSDDAAFDAATSSDDAGLGADAAMPSLSECPTTGDGAIDAPAACFAFTPEEAGAAPGGVHGDDPHYALEPAGTARGLLVVYMSGSFGIPSGAVNDPDDNVYTQLAGAGFHVLSLAYRSTATVGSMCAGLDTCFGPTREALLRGTPMEGQATTGLDDLREDEGILPRLDAALALLAAARPEAGWDAFRTEGGSVDERIVWSNVVAAGHSQGGGHAAYIGRLFPVHRVVQLASTCDEVDGVAAAWTRSPDTFATSPADAYVGFASPLDTTVCPAHATVWEALGLDASRRFDDAVSCAGGAHAAPIVCPENLARLPGMFADE